jgi:2-keto-3-deoxy-galactonokinase
MVTWLGGIPIPAGLCAICARAGKLDQAQIQITIIPAIQKLTRFLLCKAPSCLNVVCTA